MVGISALAHFMTGPGQSYSMSAFKEPMRDSLGLSETQFSLPYGVATIISGLLLTFVGTAVDRWGARRTLPTIALLLGASCAVMANVDSTWSLYVGFAMIRSIGQGALSLVAMWIVGEWFLRRRGLATSVSNLGSAVSVMVLPLLNRWLIETYGWRDAWLVLGGIVIATLVVPAWLMLRDRPEEIGWLPDGDPAERSNTTAAPHQSARPADDSWTVGNALRDPTFWKVCCVPCTSALVGTGIVFHQVSLLGSRGVPPMWALALISIQATFATLIGVYVGWLSDRWPYQRMLAAAMAMLATGVLLILFLPHPVLAGVLVFLFGIHGAILRSAGTVVWLHLYGRQHQGAVRGAAMSLMIFAAAIGPIPPALALDRWNSFDPALIVFAVMPVIAGILVLGGRSTRLTDCDEPG